MVSIVFMANVHVKLRRWTSNARDNPTACVIVVDDAVKHILVIVGVDVAMLSVEMPWLTVGEVIVGMRSGKAKRREQRWENVEDDKHCSVDQQVQQDTSPN